MSTSSINRECIWLGPITNTGIIPCEGRNCTYLAWLEPECLFHIRCFDSQGSIVLDHDEATLRRQSDELSSIHNKANQIVLHEEPNQKITHEVISTAQKITISDKDKLKSTPISTQFISVTDVKKIQSIYSIPLIGWNAGARAEFEIFQIAHDKTARSYQMKHSLPLSSTIRPPVEFFCNDKELKERMEDIDKKLKEADLSLKDVENARDQFNNNPCDVGLKNNLGVKTQYAKRKLESLGESLFQTLLPKANRPYDYKFHEIFLELGIDESLLRYPWELMIPPHVSDRDHKDHLCMNNFIGRFIHTTKQENHDPSNGNSRILTANDKLKILVIAVSDSRLNGYSDRLDFIEKELSDIKTAFGSRYPNSLDQYLTILGGPNNVVNRTTIQKTLDTASSVNQNYHIIHFCGHVDPDSGLILTDEIFDHNSIIESFKVHKPILCFVNGCEGANVGRFDERSLAKTILKTGAYFLGSRLMVRDDAAACFALHFYNELVNGESIGRAVTQARKNSKSPSGQEFENFEWTSYVYYGDPRLRFPCNID
jgi:hypothetical protein